MPALDAERRDHDAAQGNDRGGHADDRDHEQQPDGRDERRHDRAREPGRGVERDLRDQGPRQEEQADPRDDPDDADEQGLDRSEPRHLRGGRSHQPQRRQSLFATRGRKPRRGRDEDRDRDQGADDRQHDHHDRHQRQLGGLRRRIERGDRGRTQCLECRRLEADDGNQLVRRPKTRVTDRPDDRPDAVAELVGRHALQERGERRRDDSLTGSGDAVDARRCGWCVDQAGDQDPHEWLARVDVDVRPDEQSRTLGGPGLRHDEARAPRGAQGTLVEGRLERQCEQQDRRSDGDRERGQAQADRRSPAPAQGKSEREPGHVASAPLRRPSRTMISRWA